MAKTIEHKPTDDAAKPKSMMAGLIVAAVLIVASGGTGFAFSKFYLSPQFMSLPAPAEDMVKANEDGGDKAMAETTGEIDGEAVAVTDLEAITTNISDPNDVWLRAEFALLHTGKMEISQTEAIHQELLGYLRSTKLNAISTASGVQHLMEDVDAIARLRSDGQVQRVLIRGLIFE